MNDVSKAPDNESLDTVPSIHTSMGISPAD